MTNSTIMGFVVGALQFIVAAYALRLNRVFGTARVGWSLFSAFGLLALLHLFQSVTSFGAGAGLEVQIEVMYALVSFLLFLGMTHLESLLKERLRLEQKEKQIRAELEMEVEKKTAYLMRAIEQLQAEMDERKRMDAEMDSLNGFLNETAGSRAVS